MFSSASKQALKDKTIGYNDLDFGVRYLSDIVNVNPLMALNFDHP